LHKTSLYQPPPLLLESKTRIFFTHTAVRLLFFLYKGEEEGEKTNLLPLTPPLQSVCRSLSLSLCLPLPLAPVKPAKASKKLTIKQELDTKLHIYNPLLRISHTKQQ
jgi:hypothetical protein